MQTLYKNSGYVPGVPPTLHRSRTRKRTMHKNTGYALILPVSGIPGTSIRHAQNGRMCDRALALDTRVPRASHLEVRLHNSGYTPVGISENAVAPPPHSFTNHSSTICSRALIRLRNSQYSMSKVVVNWFCTRNELGAVYTTAVTTFANTTAVPSRAGGLDSSSS